MQVGGPLPPPPLPLTDWSEGERARWRRSGQGAGATRLHPESEKKLQEGHGARATLGPTWVHTPGCRHPPLQLTSAQGTGEAGGDRGVFLGLP